MTMNTGANTGTGTGGAKGKPAKPTRGPSSRCRHSILLLLLLLLKNEEGEGGAGWNGKQATRFSSHWRGSSGAPFPSSINRIRTGKRLTAPRAAGAEKNSAEK